MDYALTDNYDGVVLDVMMPNLDGFSVVRRLRAPCTIQFIWRGTLRERNPLLKPNKTAAG